MNKIARCRCSVKSTPAACTCGDPACSPCADRSAEALGRLLDATPPVPPSSIPAPVDLSWIPPASRSVGAIQAAKPAALGWGAWTDRDRWTLTDPAALNAENDAVAADEVAAQAEAEAVRYDRDRAEADLDAWLDAIEADRDAQDRLCRGVVLC